MSTVCPHLIPPPLPPSVRRLPPPLSHSLMLLDPLQCDVPMATFLLCFSSSFLPLVASFFPRHVFPHVRTILLSLSLFAARWPACLPMSVLVLPPACSPACPEGMLVQGAAISMLQCNTCCCYVALCSGCKLLQDSNACLHAKVQALMLRSSIIAQSAGRKELRGCTAVSSLHSCQCMQSCRIPPVQLRLYCTLWQGMLQLQC